MNDAQKLLDLFYRLHFAMSTGLNPRYGYGNHDEEIAAGKMPAADVFDGNHRGIYSNALNLHAAHKMIRNGTDFATVYVANGLRGDWDIHVSCAARGYLSPDEAAFFSEALAFAVKAAKACEEIVATPIDFEFDIRHAQSTLDDAIRESWDALGKEGDPEDALAGAWGRIMGSAG